MKWTSGERMRRSEAYRCIVSAKTAFDYGRPQPVVRAQAGNHSQSKMTPKHLTAGCYVITGASGAGKSTLVAALNALGYATVPEAALCILREELERGGSILPWVNRPAFMEEVFKRNVRNHQAAQSLKVPIFFDRGIPECLAWLQLSGLSLEPHHVAAPAQYRYAQTVFVAEPWPEVYEQNAERQASFERATRSYAPTVDAYVQAGYSTCVIPKVSVQARVTFVLEQVEKMM